MADSIRDQVRAAVADAWSRAEANGALPLPAEGARPTVELDRPSHPEHGDFASNLALKLARPLRMAPPAIATALAAELASVDPTLIAASEPAGPGFVNLRLADAALERVIDGIAADSSGWGRVAAGPDATKVNVEFVSANPTGPLTVGNARGAFAGDLLSRVLEAAGQRVTREYYFNDSGTQVYNLGLSVLAVKNDAPVPEDGYHGDYIADLAKELPAAVLATSRTDEDRAWAAGRWASDRIRAGIEASLDALGVHFDVWTTEGSLHEHGWVDQAIERLREGGHLYEQDGALWFRSTAFGDDKDRVVIRSNGQPTYFAADLGYVTEKFSRGFDHLIYIWGSDHHGTVARNRNAAEAMGFDREHVEMLLTGWVRFIRDGQEVSMSKRAGTFVTLDELLAEVGVDAARWIFGSRGTNVDIDFDIELAKKQSNDNPVYYVQYAHARIASILRKGADSGLAPASSVSGILGGIPEAALSRQLIRFPDVVADGAAAHEVHGVTTYATELATAFHAFYRDARVVDPDEPERSSKRLTLVQATQITLASALALLGISAPESM
jgi:arginyl-tRNA synthetase